MVPEMIKRLERSSLEKNQEGLRDFTVDSGESHLLPQENSRVKTQRVFPLSRDFVRSCLVGWEVGALGHAGRI